MLKKIIVVSCFLSAGAAHGQIADLSKAEQALAEAEQEQKKKVNEDRFCIYDEKKYDEGAILPVGKYFLVCAARRNGILSRGGQRRLVWEPASQAYFESNFENGSSKKR